mmetsp:Transcript_24700/g.39186  ORF Transcript_24700/g.39186 Transcript_24700/m.39186 type:complete len:262 (-) Transcript_24700:717-1502(-)
MPGGAHSDGPPHHEIRVEAQPQHGAGKRQWPQIFARFLLHIRQRIVECEHNGRRHHVHDALEGALWKRQIDAFRLFLLHRSHCRLSFHLLLLKIRSARVPVNELLFADFVLLHVVFAQLLHGPLHILVCDLFLAVIHRLQQHAQLVAVNVAISVIVKLMEDLLDIRGDPQLARQVPSFKLLERNLAVSVSVNQLEALCHILLIHLLAQIEQHLLEFIAINVSIAVSVNRFKCFLGFALDTSHNMQAHQVLHRAVFGEKLVQ